MEDNPPPRVLRAQRIAGEGRGPQDKGDHRLRKSKGSGGRSSKALASLPRGVAGEQAAESSATAHPLPVPPSSGENDEPLQPLLRTHDSVGTTGCCGRLRHTCHRLVTWPPFDFFILAVIIASCITMATQSPLDAAASVGTPKAALYALVEDVYTYIFTAEVVAKLIAFGPSDYFGDGWNVFDFIVVSTAWLQRLPGFGNYTVLRAVRVLRALRMVNRVKSLKLIVESLLGSLSDLGNVSALFTLFLFLMSIVGVNLFAGKMHFRCTVPGADAPVADTALCVEDADCSAPEACVYWPVGPCFGALSYDNVISAFASIFQAVTLEGWVDQMYMLRKTAGEASAVIFFLVLVLVGSHFIVNLFLAVLFESFNKAQEERSKSGDDSDESASAAAPGTEPPHLGRRASMWTMSAGSWDSLVYLMITLNTIVMCSNFHGEPAWYAHLLNYANDFFVAAFTLEMVLKLCTSGRAYFTSYWNRFDFVVTLCSLLDMALEFYGHDTDFLRALRVARVLRLLRLNPQMKRFEGTLAAVSSLVLNLTAILVLIMCVFALLGMELFGGEMGSLPPRTHFDDFASAFVTVFTLTSGEDWNAVFASTLEGGAPWSLAALYFVPMFLIQNYVLVNLFVAIICWGWDSVGDPTAEDRKSPSPAEQLEHSDSHLPNSDSHLRAGGYSALARDADVLQAELQQLRAHHLRLSELVRKLSAQRHFGLTSSDADVITLRLQDKLGAFVHACASVPEDRKGHVAGVARGFGSLCEGQRLLLGALSGLPGSSGALPAIDQFDAVWPEPSTRLLFEYWDCMHAREGLALEAAATRKDAVNEGVALPPAALPPPRPTAPLSLPLADKASVAGAARHAMGPAATDEELTAVMRSHVLTLMLYPELMADLKDIRIAERERRVAERAASAARAKRGWCASKSAALEEFSQGRGDPNVGRGDPSEKSLGRHSLPLDEDTGGSLGAMMRLFKRLVSAPAFEAFIIVCIALSSVALAFDVPSVVPGSPLATTLFRADVTFTAIFTLEMALKMLVFGLWASEESYFRSGWNVLDFAIVSTSVISLLFRDVEELGGLRALRALRALRPLRVIRRFNGLRRVVKSLLRAVPLVGSVVQVCALVFIVYGLFGMQFLMGRMAACTDRTITTKRACVGEYVDPESGEMLARWWGNDDLGHFDNIGMATLTLFELSSLEMWPDVLWRAMDSDPVHHDHGPELNANPWMASFVITWIVVSNFILLNLFVGVVLENFNAIRKQEDGSVFMSDAQLEWANAMRSIFSVKPTMKLKEPSGKGWLAKQRRKAFKLIYEDVQLAASFERFVACLVLLNVLSMAVTWYDQPPAIDVFADIVDWFFTAAFTLEMLLKLFGLGFAQYFGDGWNVLDMTLVSLSLLDHALTLLAAGGLFLSPTTLRFLRFFRIVRLLKLIKVAPGIKRLLSTVVASAPALANVGVLVLLVLYIYAVLGIELFGHVAHGEFINDDANFETFGAAMLTMVRCITGESYNGIMHDAMVTEARQPGRCSAAEGTCGDPLAAIAFFISFVVIGSYVMLNVFVAVVIDAFADDQAQEQAPWSQVHVDDFVDVWQRFDPDGNHLVPTKDLTRLLRSLGPPVGFRTADDAVGKSPNLLVGAAEVMGRLRELKVQDRAGQVAFHDLLEACGKWAMIKRHSYTPELPLASEAVAELEQVRRQTVESIPVYRATSKSYTPRGRNEVSSEQMLAILKMQKSFRAARSRRGQPVSEATNFTVGTFNEAAALASARKREEILAGSRQLGESVLPSAEASRMQPKATKGGIGGGAKKQGASLGAKAPGAPAPGARRPSPPPACSRPLRIVPNSGSIERPSAASQRVAGSVPVGAPHPIPAAATDRNQERRRSSASRPAGAVPGADHPPAWRKPSALKEVTI